MHISQIIQTIALAERVEGGLRLVLHGCLGGMSEKKRLKQALKSVWDRVKTTRDERAKRYDPYDILQSADQLAALANELRSLGTELSALQAMPAGEPLVTGISGKTED